MDLFKLLTKNSFDIISVLDRDGSIKFESDACEKILGYKSGERIGKNVFDYLHPDDKKYVIKEFTERNQKIKRLEFRLAHKKGNWVWLEAIGQDFLNDPEINGIIVNYRDINEYKKEQKKLTKSQKGYKRLINNSNSLILEIDADNYEIVSCNIAMAKHLNQDVQSIIGENIKNVIPTETLSKKLEYGKNALAQNNILQFEEEIDDKVYLHRFIPYVDQHKRYIQIITIEITESKKAEKELKESEAKYKELFQLLEEGFVRVDTNGIITMANNSMALLAGYESSEELVGFSMNKLYAIPSERSKMLTDLQKNGTLRNYKVRLITKAGDIRWTSCSIKFFKDQNNKIAGTEGLVRDITEQKRLEEKVVESQQRFKQFMDHIPGAAFLKDRENNLLYCNEKYAAQLGTTPKKLIQGNALENVPKHLQKKYQEENQDIIEKGNMILSESEFSSKKGSEHWLTYKFPVSIQKETFIGAISIDITDRKKVEEALQKREAQYRELNATKDKFFSIISHDLKGPFNSILGFSKLITKKVRNQEYQKVNEFSEFINKSAQKSYDLLDNLLQWSRIQTGRIEFNPETIKLKVMVDAACILLSPNYKAKNIQVTNSISEDLQVKADQFMLDTVIRNLLSNAIKFTYPKGKITIQAKQESKETTIEVKDNGVGINQKDIKKLFKIENTNSSEGTDEEKGTGLGLILCKEFVERHGGNIWVESKEGVGTKFIFTIPCRLNTLENSDL